MPGPQSAPFILTVSGSSTIAGVTKVTFVGATVSGPPNDVSVVLGGVGSITGYTTGIVTAIGIGAGVLDVTTNENTWVGYHAGAVFDTDGSGDGDCRNTGLGAYALQSLQNGTLNTAVGAEALVNLTIGGSNTVIGANAGHDLVTGSANTIVGRSAGNNLVGGANNVLVGDSAGGGTTGSRNIVIGSGKQVFDFAADDQLNIGDILIFDSLLNVRFGKGAVGSVTIGDDNIGIGYFALGDVSSGAGNIGIGKNTLLNVSDNSLNIAIGVNAGIIVTGIGNTILGSNLSNIISSGNNNVAVGINANIPDATANNQISINGVFQYDGNNAEVVASVAVLVTTVGSLPTPIRAGARATVTDATTPTFGLAVVGGGAVTTPVYWDLSTTTWRVG